MAVFIYCFHLKNPSGSAIIKAEYEKTEVAPQMEFRNLLCFVAAARHSNFTKAAGELFISQSALSQSIRRLENELGTKLFTRTNGKVVLTHAGRVLLPEAEELLAREKLLREHMSEIGNIPEQLNLGISSFYSKYYLPELTDRLECGYQDLRVNFVEDVSIRLEEMVKNGILDCCLVPMPVALPELCTTPVRVERIFMAFPEGHPVCAEYGRDDAIPMRRLADEKFVFLKPTQRFAAQGMRLCEEAGFRPRIIYESMNWDTVDAVIGRGIGIGFVPDILTIRKGPDKPEYRAIDSPDAKRGYTLLTRPDSAFTPTVIRFLSEIPELIAALTEQP